MIPLGPDVEVHRLPGEPRLVLWQRKTGRAMLVAEDALVAPSEPLLARMRALHLLSSPIGLGALVPVRSRWPLLFPDSAELWVPRPSRRGPGGFPFTALPVSERQVAAWRLCNGARTVAQVSQQSGLGLSALFEFFGQLTNFEVQALSLRDGPIASHDGGPDRLIAPPRPAFSRPRDGEGTDTGDWHRGVLVHEGHFDDVETTLAHAFAVPHPALEGQTYGARLGDALAGAGLLGEQGVVLEVGPGTGELGSALHAARPALQWWRLDLAPGLLNGQEQVHPNSRSILGDALAMPIEDASLDWVICNEVIADLPTAPDRGDFAAMITPEPGQRLFNVGAFRFMEELARVLRPGGAAFVSEFGGPDELPTETAQLDHPEVSVHFGQLAAVAARVGLSVKLVSIAEFLDFDLRARWLSRASYEGLRARLRAEGERLEARAWTLSTLRLPWSVEGLREVPIHEDGPGPVVTRFFALLIQR